MTLEPTVTPRRWLPAWCTRRRLLLAMTLLLLAGLYRSADWRSVASTLASLHLGYFAAAMLLFVPQTLLSGWRWQRLLAPVARISFLEAVRQTLAASALNLVVPSKLGDLSKTAMTSVATTRERVAIGWRATIEKLTDAAALGLLLVFGQCGDDGRWLLALVALAWCVDFAWAMCDRRGISAARSWWCLAPCSLLLWCLHLAQIDLLLKSAGVFVSPGEVLARIPMALYAGLVPVAAMGIGTRDAALVWLFSDVAAASTMAAVGLLTALRYLVPGAVGIPLLGRVSRSTPAAASKQITGTSGARMRMSVQ